MSGAPRAPLPPKPQDDIRSSHGGGVMNSQMGPLPTLMGNSKKSRQAGTTRGSVHHRGLSLTSAPIGFFGQTHDDSATVSPVEDDTKSKQSTMPPLSQATQPQTGKLPSSSEVLFLKRLLYLKASIDNE